MVVRVAVVLASVALGAGVLAQTDATCTGPNVGDYDKPSNWNIGTLPSNAGGPTFSVIIPAGGTVEADLGRAFSISALDLGLGVRLVVDTLDFPAFLNDWAMGDRDTDFNCDMSVNTQDFLVFLNLWSAGC